MEAGWVGMGVFGARIRGKMLGFWENAGILGCRAGKLMLGARFWGKIMGFWENAGIWRLLGSGWGCLGQGFGGKCWDFEKMLKFWHAGQGN